MNAREVVIAQYAWEAREAERAFARDFVRCCRAFAEDEHQDPERRAEWAEWARRVEEVLDDGDR